MRYVYMSPTVTEASADDSNSINQIILRLSTALPEYGWELTENVEKADIIAVHAGQSVSGYRADVAHCHGLYPTGMHSSPRTHFEINRRVIDSLATALEVTVPSQWVADILSRELHLDSTVVPWAVNSDEWQTADPQGYTLWNKTRTDAVCDPEPIRALAKSIPQANFVTTFLDTPPKNVRVVGRQKFSKMQEIVRNASIYVATTKETFGIGILEAMACGQPILAYDWGAVPDYVEHGISGFLAAPNNLEDLVSGWHYCNEHRLILGQNARKVALNYSWDMTAWYFSEVYNRAFAKKQKARNSSVAIVIPSHNYGHFLEQAVNSAMQQQTEFAFKVIVVDDASTDDTPNIMQRLQKAYRGTKNAQLIYLQNNKNLHVAETRNRGIEIANTDYIMCLDADDRLGDPKLLQHLKDYLDNNPQCGIAYSRLATFQNEQDDLLASSPWPGEPHFEEHFKGLNQVPTCNLFRRKLWQRAQGYKTYAIPNEDAELWSRMLLMGYTAELAVPEHVFQYRWHEQSLTKKKTTQQPVQHWTWVHPWQRINRYPSGTVVDAKFSSWPVFNYDVPLISIIIPVGPGHTKYLTRALDSVYAQHYWNWECVVINDTGEPLETYSWVRVINGAGETRFGSAARARNAGIRKAKGVFVTFLDADDFYHTDYLKECLWAFKQYGRYIYTDYIALTKQGERTSNQTAEYSLHRVFNDAVIHTVNIFIPLDWIIQLEGFDESMDTWEDIDLFFRLAIAGYCGRRLPKPLITYDYRSGELREKGFERKAELSALLRTRYGEYMEPATKTCACAKNVAQKLTAEQYAAAVSNGEMLRIQYHGPLGGHSVIGISKQNYGWRRNGDIFYVWVKDQEAQPERFVPLVEVEVPLRSAEIPKSPTAL